MRSRIKICGLTTPELAEYAARCGADAVGLNFFPKSIRYIDLDVAKDISEALPIFVSRVAVLVNPSQEFVERILSRIEIDYLQFHGDENAEFCASFGMPYIKVIRVNADTRLEEAIKQYPDAESFLLDKDGGSRFGGTGKQFNWDITSDVEIPNLILAGGLNESNVCEAIKRVKPYCVDVSSGVETDGVKDKSKIKAFCDTVLGCQHT